MLKKAMTYFTPIVHDPLAGRGSLPHILSELRHGAALFTPTQEK